MHQEKPEKNKELLGTPIISFQTTEGLVHERTRTWYIGLAIGIILGVALGLYQQSYSLCFVSLMIGVVYLLVHKQKPKEIMMHVTTLGIIYDTTFIQYGLCKKFWIIWKPNEIAILHVVQKEMLPTELMIPIPEEYRNPLKTVLSKYITEIEDATERTNDLIARKLKL